MIAAIPLIALYLSSSLPLDHLRLCEDEVLENQRDYEVTDVDDALRRIWLGSSYLDKPYRCGTSRYPGDLIYLYVPPPMEVRPAVDH